jgi:ABC-type transporter Mla maintaining outer membrane lipid asymmetry permease subunit MlaE
MDQITQMMKSPVFAGFIRALVACACGMAVKHGVEIGSYVEPITGGIVMVLVMWWSQRAKKPRGKGKPGNNAKQP